MKGPTGFVDSRTVEEKAAANVKFDADVKKALDDSITRQNAGFEKARAAREDWERKH